jgi:hypothetical protein
MLAANIAVKKPGAADNGWSLDGKSFEQKLISLDYFLVAAGAP